jgi:hypothetical protein
MAAERAGAKGGRWRLVIMIRWEEDEESGEWRGFSGELVVATVASAPSGSKAKWLWEVKAVERPPGARNSGQRTTALAARRAADDYWSRWLEAAALKPDIERLAELS